MNEYPKNAILNIELFRLDLLFLEATQWLSKYVPILYCHTVCVHACLCLYIPCIVCSYYHLCIIHVHVCECLYI